MSSYKKQINLLIADDHHIMLDGLVKILETEPVIGNIITCSNGKQALDLALENDIDCVLMDINMPVLNGLEATKQLKISKPEIRIIIISMLCEPAIVGKLLKAGANAFINKESGKEELMRALNKVLSGERYISPDISLNLYEYLSERPATTHESNKTLTQKETEILKHIAAGLTNKEIALQLFISTSTVDTHRKNMLAKFELKNTAALIRHAMENKLI